MRFLIAHIGVRKAKDTARSIALGILDTGQPFGNKGTCGVALGRAVQRCDDVAAMRALQMTPTYKRIRKYNEPSIWAAIQQVE